MTRARTPLWVRATVLVAFTSLSSWLVAVHLDRTGNEHRLSAVASEIAGRPVKVHCPGVIEQHLFAPDTVDGTVQFDADGRPSDTTDLRATPCAELDALAEGRRPHATLRLAYAVDTLTHESFHLSGISGEALTECHALDRMAWTARQLGASALQAQQLADIERRFAYPRMPEQYQMDCTSIATSTSSRTLSAPISPR